MIKRLWDEAEAAIDTHEKLRKRLRMAAGVLLDEYRVLFPANATVDYDRKRMLSSCGRYALQWTNNGETSIGSVYLITLRASLGATAGV